MWKLYYAGLILPKGKYVTCSDYGEGTEMFINEQTVDGSSPLHMYPGQRMLYQQKPSFDKPAYHNFQDYTNID